MVFLDYIYDNLWLFPLLCANSIVADRCGLVVSRSFARTSATTESRNGRCYTGFVYGQEQVG